MHLEIVSSWRDPQGMGLGYLVPEWAPTRRFALTKVFRYRARAANPTFSPDEGKANYRPVSRSFSLKGLEKRNSTPLVNGLRLILQLSPIYFNGDELQYHTWMGGELFLKKLQTLILDNP